MSDFATFGYSAITVVCYLSILFGVYYSAKSASTFTLRGTHNGGLLSYWVSFILLAQSFFAAFTNSPSFSRYSFLLFSVGLVGAYSSMVGGRSIQKIHLILLAAVFCCAIGSLRFLGYPFPIYMSSDANCVTESCVSYFDYVRSLLTISTFFILMLFIHVGFDYVDNAPLIKDDVSNGSAHSVDAHPHPHTHSHMDIPPSSQFA